MSERFCRNCRHGKQLKTLLGTGTYGGSYHYVCQRQKGKSVFKHGVCDSFKREGEA